jgi:serine protease Do
MIDRRFHLACALALMLAGVPLQGAAETAVAEPDAVVEAAAAEGEARASERNDLLADEANTVSVVRRFGPSVVAVHITLEDVRLHPLQVTDDFEGGGSGFVIDDGRIITNFHVVVEALGENGLELRPDASLTVSFLQAPGEEFPVRVHGANPDYDLALLEFVNGEDLPPVEPLRLGDSDQVEAGQKAIAIGAPFGLQSTVTTGIVSAIEREQPGLVGIEIPFIQTDAAINVGNSGGPLLNSRGEVIGINNAILASPGGFSGFMGVGFAVPVNLLRESLPALLAGGLTGIAAEAAKIQERARLGISVPIAIEDYPPPVRQQLDLPEHGVVVAEVTPGGPADQAGMEGATAVLMIGDQPFPVGGDVILAVNGQETKRVIDVQQVILEHDPGDTVTVRVWREGQEFELAVTLEVVPPPRPDAP